MIQVTIAILVAGLLAMIAVIASFGDTDSPGGAGTSAGDSIETSAEPVIGSAALLPEASTSTPPSDGSSASVEAPAPTPDAASTPDTTAPEPAANETAVSSVGTSTPAASAPAGSGQEACSAADYALSSDQTGWPEAVAAKRLAIVEAATACDFETLASLLGASYTVAHGGGDPATLWAEGEARGEGPMRTLVQLLDLPYGVIIDNGASAYVWPSAYTYEHWSEIGEAERLALAFVHTPEEIRSFEQFGRYAGYRVVITEAGRLGRLRGRRLTSHVTPPATCPPSSGRESGPPSARVGGPLLDQGRDPLTGHTEEFGDRLDRETLGP